jgi:hypothetical protein
MAGQSHAELKDARVRVPSAPPFYWVSYLVNQSTSLELVFLFAAILGAHPVGSSSLRSHVNNCSRQLFVSKIWKAFWRQQFSRLLSVFHTLLLFLTFLSFSCV